MARIDRGAPMVLLAASLVAAGACDGGGAGGPSSRVRELVRGDEFSRLVVEVDHVPGVTPRSGVREGIRETFEELLDKDEVVVEMDGEIDSRGDDHGWSFDELRSVAEAHFDRQVPADTIKVQALLLDGHSARDEDSGGKVLGLAWDHTHHALFLESLADSCEGGVPGVQDDVCAAAEETVWTHEIGHNVGLVDNGLPMVTDHRDEEHGKHDESEDNVMYWAHRTDDVVSFLADRVGGGSPVPDFGEASRQDVAAVRDAP